MTATSYWYSITGVGTTPQVFFGTVAAAQSTFGVSADITGPFASQELAQKAAGVTPATPLPTPGAKPPVKTTKTPVAAATQIVYTQPGFDPRMANIPLPGNMGPNAVSYSATGEMVWAGPTYGYPQAFRSKLNFLFNPSTIDNSAAIYSGAGGAQTNAALQFTSASALAAVALPMNQTISFSLLFDRSFEVWGSMPDGNVPVTTSDTDASVYGVQVDYLCMQQFTGQLIGQSAGNGSTKQAGASAMQGAVQVKQGTIFQIPSYIYFGPSVFYGYINSVDCQTTGWSQYMVPIRSVMNFSFTTMIPPSGAQPPLNAWSNLQSLTPGVPTSGSPPTIPASGVGGT